MGEGDVFGRTLTASSLAILDSSTNVLQGYRREPGIFSQLVNKTNLYPIISTHAVFMSIIDNLVSYHGASRQLFNKSMNNPQVFDEFMRHLFVHNIEAYRAKVLVNADGS